jgi:hypothetical protein
MEGKWSLEISRLSVTSSNHITTLLFTDTQATAKPYNSQKDYIGGQKCDKRSWNMSRDVQNAKDTKSTPDQLRHCYNQYTPNQKLCPSKQSCLTSLLSCQSHKGLIPYTPSLTKVAQKWHSLFHAMKTSQQKKRLPSISNTCLLTLAYQPKSSVIKTCAFMSKFMQAVCKVMGVKHVPSMVYHPRTNGQSERSNQWLETAI